MPAGYAREVQLGIDPLVTVFIYEDEGNLFFQVVPDKEGEFDLDGFFFNLNDDSQINDLVIFPLVNQETVTGFTASADGVNTLSNGATLNDTYDVGIEFGQVASSTAGTVDTGSFTFYLDSQQPLTADDIDLKSLTAVVNSDDGTGQVLLASGGVTEPVLVSLALDSQAVFDQGPGWYTPDDADVIQSDDHWYFSGNNVAANGFADGALTLATVHSDGPVSLDLTGRINEACNFESWQDTLRVEVQIDGGDWITLDTFRVDQHSQSLVGDQTGQHIGEHMTGLNYSGGILDTVGDSAQFRIVADFTSYNEFVEFSEIEVSYFDAEEAAPAEEDYVAQSENFNHLWIPEQSDIVEGRTDWDIRWNALHTDGHDDGKVTFEEIETDNDVAFTFDARAGSTRLFENSGRDADSLRVEVQIDDGDWTTLDTFMVNDHGTALVGDQTGQEITNHYSGLSYTGGALDTAQESVQFRFVSDISSSNEDIYIDNVQVTVLGEPAEEADDHAPSQYDILFQSLLTDAEAEEAPATDEAEEDEVYA